MTVNPDGAPAGTYYDAKTKSYVADPGGTYSTAGATAPTTDPAGTYSSPDALDRLVLVLKNTTPANVVLSFNSATAVENYYGKWSSEATLAKEFFATNYAGTGATLSFTRMGVRQRPHLLGANISDLSLNQLRNIKGSLSLTFDGYTYSGHVNLSGVSSANPFVDAARKIERALNRNLQVAAVTADSSIAKKSVSLTGSASGKILQVTSVSPGSTIEIGGLISGPGVNPAQIVNQLSGTPGGVGEYVLFTGSETVPSETMTETYGVLTVGAVTSGSVAVGEQVTGAGVLPQTAILGNLSGSGPGSTWLVDNAPAQTVTGDLTMTAPPLQVQNVSYVGKTENNDFFDVMPNGDFGFNINPSSLSYMKNTAAATSLGLTRASGAIDSSPGGQRLSRSQFMNNLVQNETNQFGQPVEFGSLQSTESKLDTALAAWAQSLDGYGRQFIPSNAITPPAGSSAPTTDPAGTFSPAGASAPTPAAPLPGAQGPFTTEAAFDTAVNVVDTSTAIKDEAKLFEANVWGSDALSKYVAPYGSGLEFWIEGPTLQINVQVEPTPSTLPPGLTQSESVFLQDINSMEPDTLVAQATYNDTQQAYAGSLGLGASVGVDGNTAFASVYEPTAMTVMMVHPT